MSFIYTWLTVAALFAEGEQPAQNKGLDLPWWLPFAAIAMLFYFMLYLPNKRQKAERENLLTSLKKNDRVVTIGGIIGTVANTTDDEVTIKVDDNTKIRLLRSSIQRVVVPEKEKSGDE